MVHRNPGSNAKRITIRKRFRLFFSVIAVVIALTLLKAAIHTFDFEPLTLNLLFPSIVAGAIFIIGFLLSSILSDYKESERMPAEIRMALEAIHDDLFYFTQKTPGIDVDRLRSILSAIVVALEEGLGAKGGHSDLSAAIARIDELSPIFAQTDVLGAAAPFLVRLRSEQDILRRSVYRMSHIQKLQFVPSVHVLVQTLVLATLLLLLRRCRYPSTQEVDRQFGPRQ